MIWPVPYGRAIQDRRKTELYKSDVEKNTKRRHDSFIIRVEICIGGKDKMWTSDPKLRVSKIHI